METWFFKGMIIGNPPRRDARDPIPQGPTIQYSFYCILLRSMCIAGFVAQGLQIDPQLFRLFVEVAAFEPEHPRRIGHVMMVLFQFSEDHLTLKALYSLG
jgi:hypothetical protein